MIVDLLASDSRRSSLSNVYRDGVAYGIAYEDGHGAIELLNTTFTTLDWAKSAKKQYEHNPDYQGMEMRIIVLEVRECDD